MSDTEIEKLKKVIKKQQHEIEIISNSQKQKLMLLRQIRIVNNLTEENDKLKIENEKLKEKLKKVQNYLAYEIPHDLMNEATKKIYKMV